MKYLTLWTFGYFCLYKYIFGTRFSNNTFKLYHNTNKCSYQITSKHWMVSFVNYSSGVRTHLLTNSVHYRLIAFSRKAASSFLCAALEPVAGLGAPSRPMYWSSLKISSLCKVSWSSLTPTCGIPPQLSGSWAGRMTRPPCSCVPPAPRTAQRCCRCPSPGNEKWSIETLL